MAGAATNPDPDVFALAAAQVRTALEVTHELGGENYVLWGGREGYETLLNTDLGASWTSSAAFCNLVVEHKHKIGFTRHDPDRTEAAGADQASIRLRRRDRLRLPQRYGLEREVKLNIEANHATLAGHSFEHEIALAAALGIFGSIDMNRGDPQSGWDTDQFPNNVEETALAMYYILQAGGLGTGGFNFDAKIRRQSIDPDDLVIAHAGAMDVCARALLIAAPDDGGRRAGRVIGRAVRRLGRRRSQGDAGRRARPGRDRRPCRGGQTSTRSRVRDGRKAWSDVLNRYL